MILMKNTLKKIVWGMLSAFSLFSGLQAQTSPCMCPCTCPPASSGFHEDWSQGISPQRWFLLHKVWGQGNHGVSSQLVSIEQDNVNGITKNVLVLTTQGDLTKSSIMGVKKTSSGYVPADSPKRVGAAIATVDYFASGIYEVTMKIGRPKSNPQSAPVGLCPAIWTFHYEEHYAKSSDSTGSQLNPNDPLYQPRFKEGDATNGYYSTVNSEIDWPELGRNGNFNTALYNTYISEVRAGGNFKTVDYSSLGINVLDGKYHKYRMEWSTKLTPTTLTDSQVVPYGAYYYATDSATSPYQGFPVVKKSDGIWYVYQGASATFYVDGIKVGTSTSKVSPVSARLNVGAWFPSWAGTPNWDETKIYISDITIYPKHDEGDVLYQPESYPNDGMVAPA